MNRRPIHRPLVPTLAFVLAGMLLQASAAGQSTRPATRPATRATAEPTDREEVDAPAGEDPEEVRLSTGRDGEYSELLFGSGLDSRSRDRVAAKVIERREALEAFAADERGKRLIELRGELARARREKRTDAVGPLRAEIDPLADAYWKLRDATRREILRELSEEQLDRYVARVLQRRVAALLPPDLPAEKRDTAMVKAGVLASHFADETVVNDDTYFRGLRPIAERIAAEAEDDPSTRP